MSDFNGLRIALSSLYAQQKALQVTGQNIANVNTEGYSRQRVEMTADSGPVTPAIQSRYTGPGSGVLTGDTTRLRDQFLDLRGYQEHAVDAGLQQSQSVLSRIELAFDEPSDDGLSKLISGFLAGFDDIANNPDDQAARAQLVEQGKTLTAGFTQLDAALATQRSSSTFELSSLVDEVNTSAARIAELNQNISSAINNGFSPNELMDQRDQLVAKMAEQVGVTIQNSDNGQIDVYVGGTAIVRGTKAAPLKVEVGTDPAQTVRVTWADDSYPAGVSGAAGGLLSAVNDVIPRYRAGLAAVAQQLSDDVNAIHRTGYALDGSTGRDFFTTDSTGAVVVNPDIVADPSLIAASASAGATRDGSVAQQIAELTGVGDSYQQLVVKLGVESQAVNRRVDVQASIVQNVDAARESVSGVNLDEEMTSMLQFQHAYDAAARFLTAVDQTLDTLINSTGLVGRG
ncbi:MAG TPA: flagellar hook-associated protein FlgK [Acidimicrobiia bacterium]|nr:flagellar hook-associated protein FlgK [Acidimicrobiia bacterium]